MQTNIGKGNVISRLTISPTGRKLSFHIFVYALLPKLLRYAALGPLHILARVLMLMLTVKIIDY